MYQNLWSPSGDFGFPDIDKIKWLNLTCIEVMYNNDHRDQTDFFLKTEPYFQPFLDENRLAYALLVKEGC